MPQNNTNNKAATHALLFSAGFIAASILHRIWNVSKVTKKKIHSSNDDDNDNVKDNNFLNPKRNTHKSTNTALNDGEEMDRPDLPMRILRKAETAIQGRTSRIAIVIERCTDDHNYSAIIRTAEALGIQFIYLIDPQNNNKFHNGSGDSADSNKDNVLIRSTGHVNKGASEVEIRSRKEHNMFAKKATEWTTIREFATTNECLQYLKGEGREVWVTDLSQAAVRLTWEDLYRHRYNDDYANNIVDYDVDVLPEKLAIVFGTESVGCTQEMLDKADLRVVSGYFHRNRSFCVFSYLYKNNKQYLPLRGFADSLNLSVATALCIQQLFHICPDAVGTMSDDERRRLRQSWFPKLATQRILTPKQKKHRLKLKEKIESVKSLSKEAINHNPQLKGKYDNLPQWEAELNEIDESIQIKAMNSVRDLIDNPPAPLSDLRRADEHRTCNVGKKTRKKNEQHWKGMAATANYGGKHGSTASEFRSLAES